VMLGPISRRIRPPQKWGASSLSRSATFWWVERHFHYTYQVPRAYSSRLRLYQGSAISLGVSLGPPERCAPVCPRFGIAALSPSEPTTRRTSHDPL